MPIDAAASLNTEPRGLRARRTVDCREFAENAKIAEDKAAGVGVYYSFHKDCWDSRS